MSEMSEETQKKLQEFGNNFYLELLSKLEIFCELGVKEDLDVREAHVFYSGPLVKILAEFMAPVLDAYCKEHQKGCIKALLRDIEKAILRSKVEYDSVMGKEGKI